MPMLPPGAHLKGGQAAAAVLTAAAARFYRPIIPIVLKLDAVGWSLREIAADLARRNIRTRYGRVQWSAGQVRRVLRYAEKYGAGAAAAPAGGVAQPVSAQSQRRPATVPTRPPSSPAPTAGSGPKPVAQPAAPAPPQTTVTTVPVPTLYLLIGGKEHGPYTDAQVSAMLASGKIGPATLCRVRGGKVQRLQNVLGQTGG